MTGNQDGKIITPGVAMGARSRPLQLEAGQFQVLVLAAVMTAGALTAVGLIYLQGAVRVKPARLAK